MPFDGNPAKFAKAEVFSLEGLVAWLEQQPAATEYIYVEPRRCMMGMYVIARGGSYDVGRGEYVVDACRLDAGPFGMGAFDRIACGMPRTLGAALSRARQLLATA